MSIHLSLQPFVSQCLLWLDRILSFDRRCFYGTNVSKLCLPICLLSLVSGSVHAAGSYYDGDFPTSTSSFTQATLTIGGTARDVLIYRPAGVVSPPLLVLFTGTGGTLSYSLLDELGRGEIKSFADREGVVVAAPMPRLMTIGDWDNHSAGYYYWETATQEGIDSPVSSGVNSNPDLVFVQAVMDEAIRAYGANPDRVYFNGFSNGAFFSYFAAAVLHSRVAAFAETGGGLVLSNTTYGSPPCQPTPAAGTNGEVRSCSASGWTPQTCVSSGAVPRPVAPNAVGAVPPGYLQANDDDDSVPFAHTCNLAAALTGKTDFVARVVHNGGGHIWDTGFLQNSWDFMKSKSRLNVPMTGLWWNPNEPGWGLSIEQQGSIMFNGWYTYDQFGNSTRYFMSNCAVSGNGCTGSIYTITGGAEPTAPWTGHGPVTTVGTGTLTFSDTNAGVFDFVLNGVAGSKNLTRMAFGTPIAPPALDYTALWWNSSESGWGVFVSHQSSNMFAVLFSYDASGNAMRYVASNCVVSGNGCTGTLYKTSGGSAPTVPWVGPITQTPVGTITFTFADASNGTMSFTIDGKPGSKAISKLIF